MIPEQEQELDYETAEMLLRELLKSSEIDLHVHAWTNNTNNETDSQRFSFVLQKDGASVSGNWTCGSAVALSRYRTAGKGPLAALKAARLCGTGRHRLTVDDDRWRTKIRSKYLPGILDIVSGLLCDASSIDEYDHWADWAHEFGMLDGSQSPDDIRKLERDFVEIRHRVPLLRAMLGRSEFERAQNLARQL